MGTLDDGIDIDLGFFRGVTVDAENNRMTIGGGTVFGDVYDPLYNAGKEIRKLFLISVRDCPHAHC